jgi:hypothetical protein
MKTTTLQSTNSVNRSFVRRGFLLIPFVLAWFTLSPTTPGQLSPPPDGCYVNFTTAEGCDALNFLTTGSGNTAIGWRSLFLNSDASFNTAVGGGALALNNADSNTAVGAAALLLNTTGTENVAIGTDALVFNDSGSFNNAVGVLALFNNVDGIANNAFGDSALNANIHGGANTAIGDLALANNDSTGNGAGISNTAVGASALFENTDDGLNNAVGDQALADNTTGSGNQAIGVFALANNTTGGSNIAIGTLSGVNVTTANNVICIGDFVVGDNVDNGCYIGNIWGASGGDQAVYVNASGKLGAQVSSRRFKDDIKPMEQASEVIYDLKPVTFRYKREIEPSRPLGFGLIAEDVEKVDPDLVARDKEGKPYSVRYDQVNAMLLNEFLKEHQTVQELKSAALKQEAMIVRQQKQIEALMAGLQKVSAQLEASHVTQTVVSTRWRL